MISALIIIRFIHKFRKTIRLLFVAFESLER
jgi:hypothetical protein